MARDNKNPKAPQAKASTKAPAAAAKVQKPTVDVDVDPVGFLVAPQSTAVFMAEVWEHGPKVYTATPDKRALLENVLSTDAFLATLDKQEAEGQLLTWGMDVNAVRFVDGAREVMNGDSHDIVDRSSAAELMADGCTLQVHHPQRFDDCAWRMCAALEQQLGCLVGCNAYITPAGSQGLAPHHDDVELWVCQTQGSKKWRVYAPLDIELPEESSPDLPHEVIGKPILEVTLNVGDVLYLPRGTIHEAEAQKETSSHLTLSTYQKWNWHELAERVIEASLPSAANRLASCLRDMAMAVEDNCDVVEDAVDEMAAEFVKARLPPYPSALAPKGDIPTLDSAICCRAPGMCRLIEADSDSESDDEDGDEDDFMGAHGASEDPSCGHEHFHHAEGGGAPAAGKKGEKSSEEAAAEAGDSDGGDDDADDQDDDSESDADMEPSFRYRLITSLHNQRETHMIDMGSDGEDDDGGMGAHMGGKLGENGSDSDEDDEAPPSLVPISAAAAAKAAKGKAIAKKGKAVAEGAEAAEADDIDADLIGDVDLEEDLVGSGLTIPEGHAHAVATILGCIGGKSVRVRDLVLLGDEGDDASQTKLLMVQALHSLGVVRVVDSAAADALAAGSKKRKGDGSAPSGTKHKKKGGHKTMIKN